MTTDELRAVIEGDPQLTALLEAGSNNQIVTVLRERDPATYGSVTLDKVRAVARAIPNSHISRYYRGEIVPLRGKKKGA